MFIIDWFSVWNVFLWTVVGAVLMMIGYRILEAIVPFNVRRQLEQGNPAAAIVSAGMFIAIALLVGLLIRR